MKFYIVDASGFLFRAYFAYPEMIDKTGNNVNAVYWFFRILLKLIEEKPDYLVLTRDLPVQTERSKIDTTYKANRPAIPDDFKKQIPIIKNIVEKLWIPNIWEPWYEADDIIATLVKKINSDNITIISSDKDLSQLLTDWVVIYDPSKKYTITKEDFQKKYGFEPKYMLDYLSLTWDSADNIKWVPWIWPKIAISLIQKYKTIENIYLNIDNLTESIKNKLIQWKESAKFSKTLITLLDVPNFNYKLEDLKLNIDFQLYTKILVRDFNFSSIKKVLDDIQKKYSQPTQSSLF